MKALLLFHLRVGVRVAVRSFAPLFSAILALIMLQMYPAAAVISISRSAFAPHPSLSDVAPIAALVFALPVWAAPKLAHGLNGWLRHLPISGIGNRWGVTLALMVVQMPLALGLALLAMVAHMQNMPVSLGILRWSLVLPAAAMAATPARRRILSTSLALAAGALALLGGGAPMLLAATFLAAAPLLAGGLREQPRRRSWQAAGPLLDFRIAWRALGWRIASCYVSGFISIAAATLFISNNELAGSLAAGTARFGGGLACVLFLASLAEKLAVRRPVWPLARSFPLSSGQRIATDATFMGIHALPLVAAAAMLETSAALSIVAFLPFACLRAAAFMRRIPGRRTGTGAYLAEGAFAAALLALLPWSAILALAATVPAFGFARETERRQKVTRWMELHHASAGDTLSWEDR
jgi:hypothetical protein